MGWSLLSGHPHWWRLRYSEFELLRSIYSSADLRDIQVGLKGCGVNTAHRIARYGLGDSLLAMVHRHSDADLVLALNDWRDELRDVLRHDPQRHIGLKHKALADAVTDTFPSHKILLAYAKPLTSWSRG